MLLDSILRRAREKNVRLTRFEFIFLALKEFGGAITTAYLDEDFHGYFGIHVDEDLRWLEERGLIVRRGGQVHLVLGSAWGAERTLKAKGLL